MLLTTGVIVSAFGVLDVLGVSSCRVAGLACANVFLAALGGQLHLPLDEIVELRTTLQDLARRMKA